MAAGMITRVSTPKRTYRKKPSKKLATVGQVKRLINARIDKVYHHREATGAAIPIAGLVTPLSSLGVFQGDYIVHKMNIRFRITNVTNSNNTVRVIIFQWKDSTTPVLTDVLESASPNETYNDDLKGGMVHILHDTTHSMNLYDKSCMQFNKTFYSKRLLKLKTDDTDYWNRFYMLTVSLVDTNTVLSSVYIGGELSAL